MFEPATEAPISSIATRGDNCANAVKSLEIVGRLSSVSCVTIVVAPMRAGSKSGSVSTRTESSGSGTAVSDNSTSSRSRCPALSVRFSRVTVRSPMREASSV